MTTVFLTGTSTFSNPLLMKSQEALRGLHFDLEAEPHFRPPLLEDTSHSSHGAAWAQETSVPPQASKCQRLTVEQVRLMECTHTFKDYESIRKPLEISQASRGKKKTAFP